MCRMLPDVPKRKSPDEVAAQDARIAAAAAAGDAAKVIAKREGISDRWVRARLKRMGATVRPTNVVELPEPGPVAIDPFAEVARALAAQRQVEAEARRLAGVASQEAVRVAALKLVGGMVRDRIELLREVGALPPMGPTWVDELRLAAAWATLGEFAGRLGLDAEEMQATFEKRVPARRRRKSSTSGASTVDGCPLLPVGGSGA